ncbi:MAG: DUF1194 domain-containing protein [Pseudomonadota bacterium]
MKKPNLGRVWKTPVTGKVIWRACMTVALGLGWMASAEAACRQALVLGLDVSGSVDAQEYRLQLEGLANAIEAQQVAERLLAMPDAPVRLAVFDWSTTERQRVILPWREVHTHSDITAIATQLRSTKRAFNAAATANSTATALGTAMTFGIGMLEMQETCWKRTLDISGDGKNNNGIAPEDVFVDNRFTINGLVIGADNPPIGDVRLIEIADLSSYYRTTVLRGPDAFVETALGFRDFENAMTRKLIRELEGLVIGRLDP